MCAVFLYGCEATTRYRVLSFFFDGVPKPEAEKAAEGQKAADKGIAVRKAKTSYGHGPYEAKMCEACHLRGTNALVAPIQELCFRCHEFRMDKKFVHGPLISGDCRVCHDPHGSRYQFLLVSEAKTFCFYCHDEKDIAKNQAHKGSDMNCTSCHNAHMSDKKYLLK
ncbi:MAG: cytochrome c3 family protein [Nitrospirota bacterium]